MIHTRGLIITGGDTPPSGLIRAYARSADFIIAADSGFDAAVSARIQPDLVIGDMDSTSRAEEIHNLPDNKKLVAPRDKDETDTELALDFLRKKGYKKNIVIGGGGGRLDHMIAILHLFERPGSPFMWVTHQESVIAVHGELVIDTEPGERISLFPIGCTVEGIDTGGLKWKLTDTDWKRGDMGISNVAVDNTVSLRVRSGSLLLIINNRKEPIYV